MEYKPKALLADAITESNSCISVGDLAKILKQNKIDMGQNKLYQWFRDNSYLIKQKGINYNMPTQYAMDLKLFFIKEYPVNINGNDFTKRTIMITGKGQKYFINKFLNK